MSAFVPKGRNDPSSRLKLAEVLAVYCQEYGGWSWFNHHTKICIPYRDDMPLLRSSPRLFASGSYKYSAPNGTGPGRSQRLAYPCVGCRQPDRQRSHNE
jgi:hypothetical protein